MEFYHWGFTEIITAIGGLGIVITGLSTWIGKIIANHIVENEKAKNAWELERMKSQLEIEKEELFRFKENQFTLYMEVWNKLQDVQIFGEQLWNSVTLNGLLSFSDALKSAKIFVNRGKILLSDDDYYRINEILTSFENYYVGKGQLYEFRNSRNLDFDGSDIRNQIDNNSRRRQEYERLLNKIKTDFRVRLRIPN